MTHALNITALVLLLGLGACSAKDKGDDDVKTTATVKTVVVRAADIPEILTAYGAAEAAPSGEETLSSPVEAIVLSVRVSPGAAVAAGQVMMVLKPSPGAASELTKAAVDLDLADKAYARAQRLRATGLDSDADVEQARAGLAAAVGANRSLSSRLAGLTVRATRASVVEALSATPGDLVAAGAPLGKVAAVGAVRIRLGLEAADLGRVRVGDAVTLSTVGGSAMGSGVVKAIEPRIDPQTRLAGAVVEAKANATLGQAVRGDIALREIRAPVVAKGAIVYDQDQPGVFVVRNGVAHRRAVTLGPVQADEAAVVAGLSPGERVVVDGAAALDDGMAVSETGAPAKIAADADDAKP